MKQKAPKKYKFNAFQKKWLGALESGKYKQTKEKLFSGRGYCCLGVACDLAGIKPVKRPHMYLFDDEWSVAPSSIIEKLKLRGDCGDFDISVRIKNLNVGSLAEMNDIGKTFKEIAAFIRENPNNIFW
jgi:hypothetical protein